MLSKLIKYDMRYMMRILPWIYLGVFGMSVLISGLIILSYQSSVFPVLLALAIMPFYVGIMATSISGMVIIAIRMYQNLYSGEGYLTFTLPVEKKDIINSKIIVSAIWTLIGVVVTVLVIAVPVVTFFIMEGAETFNSVVDVFRSLFGVMSMYPGYTAAAISLIVLCTIGIMFYQPTVMLLALSIGQTLNRHRILASLGIFYGISYAIGIVAGIFSSVVTAIMFAVNTSGTARPDAAVTQILVTLGLMAVTYIGSALGAYFITRGIVEKKLNLA